ncbi:adenylyltransferase/cytidyltransferase family protein [Trinickia sp. LjRoot230]|uniref:adenylyltransferase/cytidyltransferase family protein n=1 Tax=Trinickia sp. LjRoot230 TaxID=3342288 RepID=UPI003ECFF4C9
MAVIHQITEAQSLVKSYQSYDLVVGLCHGCFDIVHHGHIHHLRQANSLVDRLFVSITADEFINKGPDRPIFSALTRAELINAIRYCHHVIVSHSATAQHVISALRPNVFFKGHDYCSKADPRVTAERALIESIGGRMIITDNAVMDSTSRIAQALMSERV